MKVTCYMCRTRRAKALTADRDGSIYVNAQNIVMFCSLKCAANYGLLWGTPAILQSEHFCPALEEWIDGLRSECGECQLPKERE